MIDCETFILRLHTQVFYYFSLEYILFLEIDIVVQGDLSLMVKEHRTGILNQLI